MEQGAIYALAIAVVCLGFGIAIRAGIWRGFTQIYRNEGLPAAARNSPFALIPAGLAFAVGVMAGSLRVTHENRALVLALFVSVPALMLAAFLVAQRPPLAFKPRWLRDEEALNGSAPMPRDWFDRVVLVGTVGSAAFALGGMALLVLIFPR